MTELRTIQQDFGRMMELAQQGFHCSEIILFMGLDAQGKVNPDAIRAVSGLAGGVGFSGDICGALTGGACLVGLYAGKGTPEEEENPKLRMMIGELMEWFSNEYQEQFGGIHCSEITGDDPEVMPSRCPRIVAAVYKKVRSLLAENGFDWNEIPAATTATAPRSACPVAAHL